MNRNDSLHRIRMQQYALRCHPKLGRIACGWKGGDEALAQLGREAVLDLARKSGELRRSTSDDRPDVFIATTLYRIGGHTALIGDFVRALHEIEPNAKPPYLIVTNCHGEHTGPLEPETIARTAIDSGKIDMLLGPDFSDRLDQLLARLIELRPRRIFLFHHPDNVTAAAGIQPEIGAQRFLVHHADSVSAFGLYSPHVRTIDLTPSAAAMSRAQELSSALLLLTAPDPGPRPVGFLQRGKLTTATSGIGHKYKSDIRITYPDAVAFILRTTGGWHIHIGQLDDSQLADISVALRNEDVDLTRFIHVPRVDSVSAALWKYNVDVYFASFPIGGARTDMEVFSSATPHVRYARSLIKPRERYLLEPEGSIIWNTWDELRQSLVQLLDEKALREKSAAVRADYERLYHPQVFAAQLRKILGGGNGWDDPNEAARKKHAVKQMSDAMSGDNARSTSEFSNDQFQEFINRIAESPIS